MDAQGDPRTLEDEPFELSPSGRVRARRAGRIHIVDVVEAIPIDEAEQIRQALPTLVSSGAPSIIFDLSETDFVGSLFLAGIVASHNAARRAGGQAAIVNPRPAIQKLLHVARLDEIVPIHASLAEARRAVEAAGS